MTSIVAFLASLAAVVLVGSFGAYFQPGEWYAALEKPAWNPPNWVFGPVWTTLYLLMAVAAWLVWRERHRKPVVAALYLYGAQLILNGIWSWLFFGLHNPPLAFVELVVLFLTVLATLLLFFPVSRIAACLLIPYVLWTAYAGTLNAGIWFLNRP